MSYDIYFTIRENKKTKHKIHTLFFGEQIVFDYKHIKDTGIFDTYLQALEFINTNNLKCVHIRKHISTSSNYYFKDYYRRGR